MGKFQVEYTEVKESKGVRRLMTLEAKSDIDAERKANRKLDKGMDSGYLDYFVVHRVSKVG